MFRCVVAFGLALGLSACLPEPDGLDPISKALIGAEVVYDIPQQALAEGDKPQRQTWAGDGTTVFVRPQSFRKELNGRWRVEKGRYCSSFSVDPDADDWTCWRVRFSDGGTRVRFLQILEKPGLINLFRREYNGTFVLGN